MAARKIRLGRRPRARLATGHPVALLAAGAVACVLLGLGPRHELRRAVPALAAPLSRTAGTAPPPPTTTTHWCIVSKLFMNRNGFVHFPHTCEVLLPCWSYFRRVNATAPGGGGGGGGARCGLVLMDGMTLGAAGASPSWHRQLVDAMGCHVRRTDAALVAPDAAAPAAAGEWNLTSALRLPLDARRLWNLTGVPLAPAGDHAGGARHVLHLHNNLLLKPRYPFIRYLDREEDARALRRRVVSDAEVAAARREAAGGDGDGGAPALHVGLFQRSRMRRITNLDEVGEVLQRRLPRAVIHHATLDGATLREQATWFATKDVIVASHGAGLTNALFVAKGTVVLQVYPPRWFWQSLDWLIEQVGGIALDWYPKGIHPVVDYQEAQSTGAQNVGRDSNFTVPAEDVVDKILLALAGRPDVDATPMTATIERLRGYVYNNGRWEPTSHSKAIW